MIKITGVMKDFESKFNSTPSKSKKTEQQEVKKDNSNDEELVKELEEPGVSFNKMLEIISKIEDEETKKTESKKMLELLYGFDTDCLRFENLQQENSPNDREIIDVLQPALADFDVVPKEILDIAKKIVAKQVAINYKKYGAIVLTNFSKVDGLGYEELLGSDMPNLVVSELTTLYTDSKLEPGQVKKQLLDDFAMELASHCNESENHDIQIPIIRPLHDLPQEEREAFIAKILANLDEGVDKEIVKQSVITQLDIPVKDRRYYSEQVNISLGELQDDDRTEALRLMSSLLKDFVENIEMISSMSDLEKAISNVPNDDRAKAIMAFTQTINSRFANKDDTKEQQNEPKMI